MSKIQKKLIKWRFNAFIVRGDMVKCKQAMESSSSCLAYEGGETH